MKLDKAYKGRPVRLRHAGQKYNDLSDVPGQLTVPTWVMRESSFKTGDMFVASLTDDKIIFTKVAS